MQYEEIKINLIKKLNKRDQLWQIILTLSRIEEILEDKINYKFNKKITSLRKEEILKEKIIKIIIFSCK
jgi:hypothetical protein